MASSPSYGDRPPVQGLRRSFAAPLRSLSFHERAGLDKSDASAEILYSHPTARIVKFTPSTAGISLTSSPIPHDTDYPVDTIETLPWASTTETTIATGRLFIEKVKGSTNFFKCKDFMHAILRNSQCWLVDGVSKFVLRIRKFEYYRIELPGTTEDDKRRVEEFKDILKKILRFEGTPCPFKRGFHVELPDSAITPRRKGQWKPRKGSLSSSPLNETPPLRRSSGRVWRQRTTSYGQTGDDSPLPHRADSGYGDSPIDEPFSSPPEITARTRSTEESGNDEHSSPEGSEDAEASSSDESASSVRRHPVEKINEFIKELERGASQDAVETTEQDEKQEPQDVEVVSKDSVGHLISPTPESEDPEMKEETDAPISTRLPASHIAPEEPLSMPDDHPELLPQAAAIENNREEEQVEDLDRLEDEGLEVSGLLAPLKPYDSLSSASSVDSFHTSASKDSLYERLLEDIRSQSSDFEDDRTPLAEPRGTLLFGARNHRRDLSEVTVTASTRDEPLGYYDEWDLPVRPITPSYPTVKDGLRNRLKSRRSLSPLPNSSGVFLPSQRQQGNHLSSALLQKACSLALVKPIEIMVLLIHIVARIASGATANDLMSGDLFRRPEQEHRRRTSNLPDQHEERRDDGTDEDDYGVPIRGRQRSNETDKHDEDVDSLSELD